MEQTKGWPLVFCVAATIAVVGAAWTSYGASARPATDRALTPPRGLSTHGANVWNLDALLRDTFGNRTVYGEWINTRTGPLNFTTTFKGECCTSYYLFTFAAARHSSFQLVAVKSGPKPAIGAAGSELPITVNHRYVYCGRGKWLYTHTGDGPLNFQIDCWNP